MRCIIGTDVKIRSRTGGLLPHANSEEGVIAVDTVVKAVYRRETNTLIITYLDQTLDVSTISQLPIEQWVFPLFQGNKVGRFI